jgi:ABC-2 type transport system ATP-binding protein
MAAVEVEQLTVRYGDVVAVDGLSFTAAAGAVTCVLGRNGAGKTSTIEALEGLRRPASGRLAVLGLDPRRDHRTLVGRVGVMLQDVGIHPAARVGELVHHAAALYPSALAPSGLLDQVGLSELARRTFRQLSGGEQRRLALALALVGRPQVVFLDEPTAGVDPAGRQQIRRIVAGLRDDGVTVLLSTHDLDEAERVADRVVIIDHGRLVADGTVASLTAGAGSGTPAEQVRFRTSAPIDAAALATALASAVSAPVTAAEAPGAPNTYRVAASPTPALIAALTAWLAERDVALADLDTGGRRTLEDVFLTLTDPNAGSGLWISRQSEISRAQNENEEAHR